MYLHPPLHVCSLEVGPLLPSLWYYSLSSPPPPPPTGPLCNHLQTTSQNPKRSSLRKQKQNNEHAEDAIPNVYEDSNKSVAEVLRQAQ